MIRRTIDCFFIATALVTGFRGVVAALPLEPWRPTKRPERDAFYFARLEHMVILRSEGVPHKAIAVRLGIGESREDQLWRVARSWCNWATRKTRWTK